MLLFFLEPMITKCNPNMIEDSKPFSFERINTILLEPYNTMKDECETAKD